MYNNNSSINMPPKGIIKGILCGVACIVIVIIAMAFVKPWYNVWSQEMEGKAEFAKAEQNRKIKIEEAKANLEAEKLNAQAEIERAKGAAEAIRIENGSLTPTYIQYLWVRQQGDLNNKTVIYVPTETNLPILEATRGLNDTPQNYPFPTPYVTRDDCLNKAIVAFPVTDTFLRYPRELFPHTYNSAENTDQYIKSLSFT